MPTPAMTLPEAIRHAGASINPPLNLNDGITDDTWLSHCGQPMTRQARGLKHHCEQCKTTIQRADATMPADLTRNRDPDQLWIITHQPPARTTL